MAWQHESTTGTGKSQRIDTGANERRGKVNGFWIVGIAINVIALVLMLAWAVRAWRQGNAARAASDTGPPLRGDTRERRPGS